MRKHLPVEPTFDAFVKEFGGEVLNDQFQHPPNFSIADYRFHEPKIIMEMKCLEVDKKTDQKTRKKLDEMYQSWRKRGDKVPLIFGESEISTDQLPIVNARQLVEVFRKPINGRLKEANRQIRSTRQNLGPTNASGVLLLCNESNVAVEHGTIVHMLVNILRQPDYSSINCIIYFTVNLTCRAPWTDKETLVWYPIPRKGLSSDLKAFLDRLSEGWFAFHQKALGEPVERIELDDVGKIKDTKFE